MRDGVKGKPTSRPAGADLRRRRSTDIEDRILEAATRLFIADGYGATTLTAVAAEAGVADRTVYLRFGRKAVLFKRVVDVAIAGDSEPVDVRGREWFTRSLTEPTLRERISAMAAGSAELMGRFGPLLAASREAEAAEAELAEAGRAGREYTVGVARTLWERAAADGLLSPQVDLEWLISTTGVLVGSDAYYMVLQTLLWDIDAYRRWLFTTLWHLATAVPVVGVGGVVAAAVADE